MSTVLIAFTALSENDLQQQIGAARLLIHQEKLVLHVAREEGIEFQVFSTSRGIIYRVMDYGYMTRNLMWKYPQIFPKCNYDNRVDLEDQDPRNEALAEELDHLIRTNQYYMEEVIKKTGLSGDSAEEV